MKKFLIAHFDHYTRRALEAAIRDLGYSAEIVQDGLDVVDRTLDELPDAILLGLTLPGVGGLEIARTLRTLQTTRQIPILFVTDSAAESTRVLQAALAGVACLQAPFEMGRVREQLMRLSLRETPKGNNNEPRALAETLAITDPPTGLFSRSYILHRLAYECARAARYQHNIAVVLLGVRDLDQIVKRYGQRGADQICMDIGGLVRGSVRMVDLVGRTAPDEFLVIAPHTDLEGADATANRLCNLLEAATFQVKSDKVQVRVCAGVAEASESTMADNLALFAHAEEALKQARFLANKRVVRG
ncbi:MAG: diguanylate cyclase [Chloroflexi bacterium]|nr:diguanylate cyclase [Chloroflexota bacterium]